MSAASTGAAPNAGSADERPQAALQALEKSLNDIFLQIGSVFNQSSDRNGFTDGRAGMRVKKAIPAAVSRFHDALDELETELIQARTVLCRDRELLKKQTAAGASATQAATSAEEPIPNFFAREDDDIVMVDKADAQQAEDINMSGAEDVSAQLSVAKAEPMSREPTTHGSNGKPPQKKSEPAENRSNGTAKTQPKVEDAKSTVIASGAEPPANALQIDFGDGKPSNDGHISGQDNKSQPENIATASGGSADKQSGPSVDSSATAIGTNKATDNQDTDISSLLPGLDSYVNDSMMDGESGLDIGGAGDLDDLFGGQQDSFDDLFGGYDMNGGGGEADENSNNHNNVNGTNDLDMSQFDDDFFSM